MNPKFLVIIVGLIVFKVSYVFANPELKPESPMEKGQRIALKTQSELVQNLVKALNEKQTVGAVDFCHVQAQKITLDQSKVSSVKIKRASDRSRNPINRATKEELRALMSFKQKVDKGLVLKPILTEEKDVFKYFAPININSMCLQCHGRPGAEVKPETLAILKKKYPHDKALNYRDGDLRGLWSLEWKK